MAAEVEALAYELDVRHPPRDPRRRRSRSTTSAAVAIHTSSALFFDTTAHRTTGSFILVDPATNLTVAAG